MTLSGLSIIHRGSGLAARPPLRKVQPATSNAVRKIKNVT